MTSILIIGLFVFMAIRFIRELPIPNSWKESKPIGCNVCMSVWTSAIVGGVFVSLGSHWYVIPTASAVSLLLLDLCDAVVPKLGPPLE